MYLKALVFSASLLAGHLSLYAQSFVPPNMDFELGTTANWTYYRGTVATGHVFSLTPSAPATGLHTLMAGPALDTFGGFPVVGLGTYSLKLSHDTVDFNTNAASYNIHVPAGGVYRLDYKYAAVLQDPGHAPADQPIMKVTAIDSATGTLLSDSLVLSPWDPGFLLSTISLSSGTVKYKPWTSASISLAGYGGHTVIVKFVVAGCSSGSGGHFGYGYIDVTGVTMTSATSSSAMDIEAGVINAYPNPTPGLL